MYRIYNKNTHVQLTVVSFFAIYDFLVFWYIYPPKSSNLSHLAFADVTVVQKHRVIKD